MSRLEVSDGNRQIGADAQFRHAAVPVQAAVDIHRDHVSAALVDSFNRFPGRAPDLAPETGAEQAVGDGFVFCQIYSRVPQQGWNAGLPAQIVIIGSVFRKLFGKQDKVAGNARVPEQLRDHIPVPGIVAAAAENAYRRLPFHAFKDALPCPEHQLPARGSRGDCRGVALPHIIHRQNPDHDTVLFSVQGFVPGNYIINRDGLPEMWYTVSREKKVCVRTAGLPEHS